MTCALDFLTIRTRGRGGSGPSSSPGVTYVVQVRVLRFELQPNSALPLSCEIEQVTPSFLICKMGLRMSNVNASVRIELGNDVEMGFEMAHKTHKDAYT